MKNYFTVYEMSKLNNISPRTLRYYDDIGLFRPSFYNPDNGYRNYNINKFEELDFIRYMRYLGISISEIKTILSEKNLISYQDCLVQQMSKIEDEISKLHTIKQKINQRLNDVDTVLKKENLETIEVKNIKERYGFRINSKIENDEELNTALSFQGKELKNNSLIIGNVALIMSKGDMLKRRNGIYSGIIIFNQETSKSHISKIAESLYCTVSFQGDHTKAAKHYKKMYKYIEDNDYEISGDAIERTLANHLISDNPQDYITEIQIPIKKGDID